MNSKEIRLVQIACLGLVAFVGSAEAQRFSDKSLWGAYGFQTDASIEGAGSAPAVGRVVYDGAGGCSATGWINLGGDLIPVSTLLPGGSWTYSVTGEGFYEAELVGVFPDTSLEAFTNAGVLVSDSPIEILILVADPDRFTIGRGIVKRQ